MDYFHPWINTHLTHKKVFPESGQRILDRLKLQWPLFILILMEENTVSDINSLCGVFQFVSRFSPGFPQNMQFRLIDA